jgi:iron complex outermembrane recepter protein
MVATITRRLRSCAGLLRDASAAAVIGLASTHAAFAQEIAVQNTANSSAAADADELTEIVVTGTRIERDGYEAPTPTSVIGADEIAAKAPTNLADFVNELPALAPANTPRSNIAFVSAGLVGINALNLRNLGENRTLVLLDGQRIAASTLTGWVDVNQIPQALVERVDVVTGGVSADWGSDAVAGVVNFILDKDFTGLKGEAQGGVTTYGDDRNYKVALTAGTGFADNRGHFLINGEIFHSDGITGIGSRKWYNGAKIVPNPDTSPGQPALLSVPHGGYTFTPGGYIVDGPLAGTYFGAGGTPLQLKQGPVSGFLYMQDGGAWPYNDIGTTGDLDPEMSRQNVFTRLSFDISDQFQVFAQGSYGRAKAEDDTIYYLNYFGIQPDNAFLPASIAAQVTDPFTLGIAPQDMGAIPASSERSSWRGVVGANGDFDAWGSAWKWDAYWQKGASRAYSSTYIPINGNIADAVDAVRDANGIIVCRSTLTNPNNGCIPFNAFGTGVNDPAVLNYVSGLAWGINRLTQDVVAGTLHGDPWSSWAGEISIAAGLEHRREAVSGSNDPLSTNNSYWAGNYHASFGSYHVTEGFIEAVVPLAKDLPLAKSLDLNGAVRATDYSTSGSVTTWKAGLTYSPIDDITVRVTRSRDIRAPNLSELFQANQTQSALLNDTATGTSPTVFIVTSGNINLTPEESDSLGVGLVLHPRFLPGFAASVDYYDIKIDDAISSVDPQTEIDQCNAGNTVFCSQVTRDPSGPLINGLGPIISVANSPINFATQIARGLDIEASYRRPLRVGNLGLRLLATHYLENSFNNGISAPTDTVGTNGFNTFLKNSLPDWRYLATVSWDQDVVALSLTARGFSDGVQNTSYIQCTSSCAASTADHQTINDNHLPGAVYFDANLTVKFGPQAETFLTVDNILNKDPVQVAYGPGLAIAPISTNPVLYDVIGRVFRLGVRFRM